MTKMQQKTRKVKLAIQRKEIIIFLDLQIIFFSYLLSFLIRFDFNLPHAELKLMIYTFPLVLGIKLVTYIWLRLHSIIWRYTSLWDLFRIIKTSVINNTALAVLFYLLFQMKGYPRSIIVIDAILFIMLFAGIRVFYRHYYEHFGLEDKKFRLSSKTRCLIIGAGDGGESLVRAMVNNQINYHPVCILDKDPKKWNKYIHGIKIQGPVEKLRSLVKKYKVEEVIIAIPSATKEAMKAIVEYIESCADLNLSYKTVPTLNELLSGSKPLTAIREIRLEDLINRELVIIDKIAVMQELRDKVVMITGAAGSIGSELARQVTEFYPKCVILIDRNENNLMYLIKEFDELIPKVDYHAFIVDITDEIRMDQIFGKYRPDFIFHAAAYKHVPFMEFSPDEAIKNNVHGTKILANLAEKYEAFKFVLISTDKAVNPVNIMGCSKKLAELYLQNHFQQSSTKFIIVRFGNVLGSEGSIIPIFKRQIRRGKAVTVTHPEMHRYLMMIPEAVSLTLEASLIGNHLDVLILDMGEQIKVLDIAENLIKLSGFKPYIDIPIKFTGIRPGEKLYEELWDNYENPMHTKHPKIFKVPNTENGHAYNPDIMDQLILGSLRHQETERTFLLLKKLLPSFDYEDKEQKNEIKSA